MGTLPSAETLRERIGGRWAITWVTYLVIIIATPVTVAFDGPESPGSFLAIVAGSAAAACAVLLLADLTVMRHRRTRAVSPGLVVAVGIVAGLARGVVVIAVSSALGVGNERSTAVIIIGSVCLGTVAVVGVALMRDAIDRHRRERAVLTARLAALREISGERTELAEAINDAAYAEMMAVLDDARRGIEVPVGELSVDDRLAVADDLRRSVNDQLRPLSHRLYAVSSRPDPTRVTGLRALVASLRQHALYPLASALVVLAVASTFAEYALAPIIVAGLVWASLSLMLVLGRHRPWARRHQMVLGLGLSGVTSGVAVALLRLAEGETSIAGVAVGTLVLVAALTVFTSLVGALVTEDGVNAQLAEEVGSRELESVMANRELARTSRDLAQYVHGTLQANLLATALAIEKAAEGGDDRAFARALADARASLAGEQGPVEADPDLAAALARIAGLWRGFIAVRTEVADDLRGPLPPALVADVARIVGEAVANARKHGGAREVLVRVVRPADGEQVDITVADDGRGPAGGVKGMGAAWLDFIAPGGWSLEPGPDGRGACLRVVLPLPATTPDMVAP